MPKSKTIQEKMEPFSEVYYLEKSPLNIEKAISTSIDLTKPGLPKKEKTLPDSPHGILDRKDRELEDTLFFLDYY